MFFDFNNEVMVDTKKILKVTKLVDPEASHNDQKYRLVIWSDSNEVIHRVSYETLEKLNEDYENFYYKTLDK